MCAEYRNCVASDALTTKTLAPPAIQYDSDNTRQSRVPVHLISEHCGETAQLFGDLLICAAARRQCIVDATFHRKSEHGRAHGAIRHRVEDYRFGRFRMFDGDGAQQWQRRVIDGDAIGQGRVRKPLVHDELLVSGIAPTAVTLCAAFGGYFRLVLDTVDDVPGAISGQFNGHVMPFIRAKVSI